MYTTNLIFFNYDSFKKTVFGPLPPELSIKLNYTSFTVQSNFKNKQKKFYYVNHQTMEKFQNTLKITDNKFKDFIMSTTRLEEYSNCRATKRVPKLDKLINKFKNDENHVAFKKAINALINHIDENGYKYFALTNSLEGSSLEQLPKELVGHIFHFVDGKIDF